MAARMNKLQTERVRASIQTTQLIKRLQKYAVGELSDADITPNRMRAIEILLRKSLPDLSAMQITGDSDEPLVIKEIKRTIVSDG